jgi:hypothetical protein
MKERPILFSAPMVRALLDGSKTQTRRVLKQATGPSLSVGMSDDDAGVAELSWLWGDGPGHDVNETIKRVACPYGKPGDRLWVRETFADLRGTGIEHRPDPSGPLKRYAFAADHPPGSNGDEARKEFGVKWKPSIHMPRAASRITLEITEVRVERLQDISRGDAMVEGCPFPNMAAYNDPRKWYADLWESINGPGSWDTNPYVWVIEFKRLEQLA